MDTTELFYPQISVQIGAYTFREGIEIEVCSSRSSYFDWAKVRFTGQFQEQISIASGEEASIRLGYNGVLDEVFSGHVSQPYNSGTAANEITLKDDMLLLEQAVISSTFLDTTPQELLAFFLAQAGVTKMSLSRQRYPARNISIPRQSAVKAIGAVHSAWGISPAFFFSGGVFYWGIQPEQAKTYTFQYGVNILGLSRVGGVWELETVSAPFVKHSHKINVVHPQINGEFAVQKVISATNDAGFIRTYIYF